MEKTMAVINQDGVVVNIIVGDENSPTESGTRLVEILPHQFCTMGFTYDGQNFLDKNGIISVYPIE